MDQIDWANALQEIEEVNKNKIAASSRASYANSQKRFLSWLFTNHPSSLTDACKNRVESLLVERCKIIKAFAVILEEKIAPIQFENLDERIFMTWLVTMKKKDGTKPQYAALSTHRSALFNLYREHGTSFPKKMENNLTDFYCGLKRTRAKALANSGKRL